jgi:serine protease AprX
MKKIISLLFLLVSCYAVSVGQSVTAVASNRYWIQFRDKNNSPYNLTNPGAFLSSRSLQRRVRQSIPIDEQDIPVNEKYVDSVAATGAHIHLRSRWFNGVVVKISTPAELTAIMNLSFVVGSTVIGAVNPALGSGREDKLKSAPASSSMKNVVAVSAIQSLNYGPSLNQINMLQGVCLHDMGYQGQGMVIAVLDAGFQHADTLRVFDSLRVNHQILGTHDFVDENDSVYGQNRHFHGTCVLSCMGGNMPGLLIGTAPKAKFWLFITEDVNSEYPIEEYNWAAGAEFADSVGADVINTSLGYTTFDDSTLNHSYSDMNGHRTPCARVANFASNKGIAVVCAAGNMGGTVWHYIGTPADADSVLAVGSVNGSGVYSAFSSEGPGSGGQVKPAVAAEGEGSIVADWASDGILVQNGTSFASPIMCGMVACLWQSHPQLSNMQLLQAIEKSATQFSHPDSMLGYGIPDFCAAYAALGIRESSGSGDYLPAVFPNPFSDSFGFIFKSAEAQDIHLELTDLWGRSLRSETRKVAAQSYNDWNVSNLGSLPPGIYLFSIKTETTVFVRKLVKE